MIIAGGQKPQIWYTGDMIEDPILVAYEGPIADIGPGNCVQIAQFENLDELKAGSIGETLVLDRSFNSKNEGSPSFEYVSFSGDIKTSSFTIFFDYQNITGSTHVAKGHYTYDSSEENGFKWQAFPARVNEFFTDSGMLETFGTKSKFMYQDSYYYLVETSSYNNKNKAFEYHIALCDSAMIPLALIPFKIPKDAESENQAGTDFFSP